MLPCSRHTIPCVFRGPGSLNACMAADPAMAATWAFMCERNYDGIRGYGCNAGLDVELRARMNQHGEWRLDCVDELKRAARKLVGRAVMAAMAKVRVSR